MNKPYIVGLTGGIASGKTVAAEHLAGLGAVIVDADQISRDLTREGGEAIPAIRAQFGDGVMNGGQLDRRALAYLVFGDAGHRRALEAILHPMVQRRMMGEIAEAAEAGATIAFLSVPLLFETGTDALCDEVWLMALEPEEQIKRVMARDGITREEAEARMNSQMSLEDKLKRADVIIRTDCPIVETRQELEALYRDLKKRITKVESK